MKGKKMIKNLTKLNIIITILMLTISAILTALPVATAQQYDQEKTTYAFIGATPNPVGVNQQVLLHVGITDFLEVATDGWEGLTVTVTKPDGNTETLGPYRTDSTGGTGAIYVPDMAGTYTFQTHFPEHIYTWPDISRAPISGGGTLLYKASDSDILELTVQQNPLTDYPGQSLPEEYWTRPIDAQLREWSVIAGSWLEGAGRSGEAFPYNDGPETAHILWTEQLTMGGLVGGDMGEQGMVCGDAYEGKYLDALIINGVFYYNEFEKQGGTGVEQVVVAVDLHTGEELWARTFLDNAQIEFGQQMYWDTLNMHGVYTYLWATSGSTWMAFDAQTGRWVYNMTDVPGGTRTWGPKGEIMTYSVSTSDATLRIWNSTAVYYNTLLDETDGYIYFSGRWRPQGRTFDASYGTTVYDIPENLPGGSSSVFVNDKILGTSVSRTGVSSWAISLEYGKEGQLLFQNTWQAPGSWAEGSLDVSYCLSSAEDNVFVVWAKETRSYYGFSMSTGDFLWETGSQQYMDSYVGTNRAFADGNFYSVGYAGIVYCYDATTGNLKWEYTANDHYNEILWGNSWPLRIQFSTDGKIYIGMEEHSSVDPKPRGAPYFCLDTETGDLVWRIDGGFRQNHWGGNSIIGDGIIAAMDSYDQRIYAIGKGPSATTLTAPDVGISLGSSAMLRGQVTDISPGTKEYALTARFPNGVPAVSDADMSEWMLYVYKQFSRPDDVSGVQVRLEAIDPNNNYQYIGTVTTDSYGFYSHSFDPELEGDYTIMASFEGSGAYYGSFAESAISVDAASASTPIESNEPASEAIISTEIAIIAAVVVAAVIGVAAYWILRRK